MTRKRMERLISKALIQWNKERVAHGYFTETMQKHPWFKGDVFNVRCNKQGTFGMSRKLRKMLKEIRFPRG